MYKAYISNTNLDGVELSGKDLTRTKFSTASLEDVNFSGAILDCIGYSICN